MQPKFLTVEETARALKRSPASVYRGIASGTIPVCKLGGALRVPERFIIELERRAMQAFAVTDSR